MNFLVELVGASLGSSLGSNLLNKATAADFAGLSSANLGGSVGGGLSVSNSSSSAGGPFLKSNNPFVGGSGMYVVSVILSCISLC